MKIVADGSITYAEEAFAPIGDVRICQGREMGPHDVRDADILLVRSVTKVDAALLDGSRVRFAATATIGTDHIDEDYLRENGIGFSSAPGTSADAVLEYVFAALLTVCGRHGRNLAGSSIAVVGVGNVGSRVAACGEALGMKVFRNDPPLQRLTGSEIYRPLDEVIGCDIVTLHVPLTRVGEDPTFHLVDESVLKKMSPGALLVNTSRGGVVAGGALLRELEAGSISAALDVWEGEPDIDIDLLKRVELGTPHIAGYSFEAKVNATVAVYRAACEFFGIEPSWDPAGRMPPADVPEIEIDCFGKSEEDVIRQAVLSIYDIRRDDAALRKIQDLSETDRGFHFEKLRREYPRRREFFNTCVKLKNPISAAVKKLEALGFATS